MPKIWNIRDRDCPPIGPDAVFCGRGSPYGNPFIIGAWWEEKGRKMTREDVCERFYAEALPDLDVSPLRGKDLICYCKPARCHCDSILRKVHGWRR